MSDIQTYDHKACCREYYKQHREEILKKRKEYRVLNKEKIRIRVKKYRDNNLEKIKYKDNRCKIKRIYNLTDDQYDYIESKRNGICPICLRYDFLHIEHNHQTGKIRGLVCHKCKRAIGLLKEDIQIFAQCLVYLTNTETNFIIPTKKQGCLHCEGHKKKHCRCDKRVNKWILQTHRITEKQYLNMLWKQDNKCAICFKSCDNLCVDHDHQTNNIRGLLCPNCNLALGCFEDSRDSILSAMDYIRKDGVW